MMRSLVINAERNDTSGVRGRATLHARRGSRHIGGDVRAGTAERVAEGEGDLPVASGPCQEIVAWPITPPSCPQNRPHGNPTRYRPRPYPPASERKSTRLNSSHEWSSYAGFCLKKK